MDTALTLIEPILWKILLANGVAIIAYLSAKVGPAVASFITAHIHNAKLQVLMLAVAKAAGTVAASLGTGAVTAAQGSSTPGAAAIASVKAQLGPTLLAQLEALLGGSQVDSVVLAHLQAASLKSVKLASGETVKMAQGSTLPPGSMLVSA